MALPGFKGIPLPLVQLSLAAVLKCGQSFRWSILTPESFQAQSSEPSHTQIEYRFCLKDRVVCLRQSPDTLFYRSVFPDPQPLSHKLLEREAETLEWLNDYFQLNIDLVSLYKQWADKDQVFSKFQHRFEGIRILRQDPWENLISFICSSNNNISRITKMVQSLCKEYSRPILSLEHPFSPTEILNYYPFPLPSALSSSSVALKLRALGFGYRADYIQRTAKMLVDEHGTDTPTPSRRPTEASEIWLKQLRNLTTDDARQELLKFVGVGRKVADCVLLMSLDKKEVVPVDTHVHQIAIRHYNLKGSASGKTNMNPKLYAEINAKFFSIWGAYAGWAHTVLFTADLKSFSSYGLPTPCPSPASTPHKKSRTVIAPNSIVSNPPVTPSPLKRKLDEEVSPDEKHFASISMSLLCEETADSLSLVDRVKRRRRRT